MLMKRILVIILIVLSCIQTQSQDVNSLHLAQQNSINANWCTYDNKYALIIMGGYEPSGTNLYGWYWGDCYRMYNRLINNFSLHQILDFFLMEILQLFIQMRFLILVLSQMLRKPING